MTCTIIQVLTLIAAIGSAIGAIYNAFYRQKPWFDDYNQRNKGV